MKKIIFSILFMLSSCVNKDQYGREYTTERICVTGHYNDYYTHYNIGKCCMCGTTYHHDWVVDTYTIDTTYTEYRTVHDEHLYSNN